MFCRVLEEVVAALGVTPEVVGAAVRVMTAVVATAGWFWRRTQANSAQLAGGSPGSCGVVVASGLKPIVDSRPVIVSAGGGVGVGAAVGAIEAVTGFAATRAAG
jgi:hypothetical protein